MIYFVVLLKYFLSFDDKSSEWEFLSRFPWFFWLSFRPQSNLWYFWWLFVWSSEECKLISWYPGGSSLPLIWVVRLVSEGLFSVTSAAGAFEEVFNVSDTNLASAPPALTGAKITVPALDLFRQHTVRHEKADVVIAATAWANPMNNWMLEKKSRSFFRVKNHYLFLQYSWRF